MVAEPGRDQLVENFRIRATIPFDEQPHRNSLVVFIGRGIRPLGGSVYPSQRLSPPGEESLLKGSRCAFVSRSTGHSVTERERLYLSWPKTLTA
jgi:hypothetical protein